MALTSGEYPVIDLRKSHVEKYRETLCKRTRSRIRSWFEIDDSAIIKVVEHVELWTDERDQWRFRHGRQG